jgi:hypothetical protein
MKIEIIERARDFYTEIVESELNISFENEMHPRFRQLESMCEVLKSHFDKTPINFLETGTSQNFRDACFGIFFGFLVRETNGKFYTVDIDGERIEKSKKIFEKYLPNLNTKFYTEDSVSFCKSTQMTFNLIHLDSWDFDVKNPFPSALHGWREFETLRDKTEDGGIVIVDDNWMKGSYLQWVWRNNEGKIVGSEKFDINYPIIGKGAHIYQYVDSDDNWDLIGNHYNIGENVKVIIKKNCK